MMCCARTRSSTSRSGGTRPRSVRTIRHLFRSSICRRRSRRRTPRTPRRSGRLLRTWLMAERYAIQGFNDGRLVELPEGCAQSGAERHAVEHAYETVQPVEILGRQGESWYSIGAVPAPSSPPVGDGMLSHYSRALDEIYRLRRALAYEASVANS